MPRILGIDPGLRNMGWGVIESEGHILKGIACGELKPDPKLPMAERLLEIHEGLLEVIKAYRPHTSAIEITFVNNNPKSALTLGMARGVALFTPATVGIDVSEYGANEIKKAVVGKGHAQKDQIQIMINHLLPGIVITSADAADALAVAICHAHHSQAASIIQTRGKIA